MEITRTFDLLDHLVINYPKDDILSGKVNGEWVKYSSHDYYKYAHYLAYGLCEMGFQPGDRIITLSANCPEWNFIDMALSMAGMIHVPVYPTLSVDNYLHIFTHSEACGILVSNNLLLRRIRPALEKMERQPQVFTLAHIEGQRPMMDILKAGISTHDKWMPIIEQRKRDIKPEDWVTLIYTSGTTGTPKGVMLTHRGILANVEGIKDSPKKNWTRSLSWMPLCHIYERMMNYLYQYLGMETFYAESIGKVAENCQETNPYIMAAVPRFIEKMYDKIYRRGEKLKGAKKKIFEWAIEIGFDYDLNASNRSIGYELQRWVADILVYRNIRKSLGKNFSMLVSGGASIQPRLTRFFSCVGLDLYEGYGLTECSPLIAVTNAYAKEGRKVGSVGFVMAGTEVRFDPDTKEILCRGPQVMKGYYRSPELTAEAIDSEGWFHTGDTGYIDKGGYMSLTGRTKHIFKTSMGKFVNPEVIEAKFKESPFILDMMVVGEGEKFAAAIIAPDFEMLKDWSRRHGVGVSTPEELVKDKIVLARYQRVMDKYNAQLGNTEQIKRFHLVTETWGTENKFLTPTLKVRRKVVEKYYEDEIKKLFE